MLRSLYDRTMRLAARRDAVWFLAAVAFVESLVFPVPPDVMLIPMVLAAPRRTSWGPCAHWTGCPASGP